MELRTQKSEQEAKIAQSQAQILTLQADIDVFMKYIGAGVDAAEPSGVKETNSLNLKEIRRAETRGVAKTPNSMKKKDDDYEEEGEEEEEDSGSEFSELSELNALGELERDPRLEKPLFPNLAKKTHTGELSDGSRNRKGRKRERDSEGEEGGESAKERHTERYRLRNGK